jgi:hypothetical protein
LKVFFISILFIFVDVYVIFLKRPKKRSRSKVNIWSHRSDIHVGPRAAHRHDDAKFLCHTSACPGFEKFLGPPLAPRLDPCRDSLR